MKTDYIRELESYGYGNFILDTRYWIIFLAPKQNNIGTCVIALKRHHGDLSGLEQEEWLEFTQIVEKLESILKEIFDATMFNWGCLMNSFYLTDNPDPHVHWHFIPRYNHKVEFEGLIFEDPYFGYMKFDPFKEIPDEAREKIIEKIKENF